MMVCLIIGTVGAFGICCASSVYPDEVFILNADTLGELLSGVAGVDSVETMNVEDGDANDLSALGAYAKAVFTSAYVDQSKIKASDYENDDGVIGGGSIEVYYTEEDALNRVDLLCRWDGTSAMTGSHTAFGNYVIRLSKRMPSTEKAELEEEIIGAILSRRDEGVSVVKPSESAGQGLSDNSSPLMATLGEKNALKKAKQYLDYGAFSRTGLINQLIFEGFSSSEAEYGVNFCGADWSEQAAKKAKDYLDYSAFSRQSLIEQLEFDGFTSSEAEYGVSAVGY